MKRQWLQLCHFRLLINATKALLLGSSYCTEWRLPIWIMIRSRQLGLQLLRPGKVDVRLSVRYQSSLSVWLGEEFLCVSWPSCQVYALTQDNTHPLYYIFLTGYTEFEKRKELREQYLIEINLVEKVHSRSAINVGLYCIESRNH